MVCPKTYLRAMCGRFAGRIARTGALKLLNIRMPYAPSKRTLNSDRGESSASPHSWSRVGHLDADLPRRSGAYRACSGAREPACNGRLA
jgi:hypothetical protein